MTRRLAAAFAAALLFAIVAVASFAPPRATPPAAAQGFEEPSKVTVRKVAFDPPTASAGGTASLRIEFEFPPPFHMYPQSDTGQRPEFQWKVPAGWQVLPVEDVSKPHEIEAFGQKSLAFEKEAVLRQAFRVPADQPPGKVEVTGTGRWQYCDDNACYLDRDVPFAATVEVVAAAEDGSGGSGGGAVAPVAAQEPPPPVESPAGRSESGPGGEGRGAVTLALLLKAIGAGLLTVLTPCVFPLLPVTVSFFSKQKGPALPRSVVYAVGIVFTITVVGLVFNTTLDSIARGWVFNLAIGLLFLVLSLSLFGLFDLRLPSFLLDFSTSKSGGGGLVGAFFMAVTLALTSFSCSMPFLALMFEDFNAGGHLSAVVGLTVYGSTMALPFFLCSLFPAAISALPKAGLWMNAIKVTMGFVEFALAFKFLRTVALNFGSDVLPRGFVLAIWAACALGAAAYLFGYLVLPHDTKAESIGVVRLVFGIAFLSAALYLLPGVFRQPLADWIEGFLQTSPAEIASAGIGGGGGGSHEIPWKKNDWDGALERARVANRPVLMDLTGVG